MTRARVLVTGAGSGLGAALVRAFVARGDRVLATDLPGVPVEPVERVVSTSSTNEGSTDRDRSPDGGGSVDVLPLDVRSDDDWAAARAWVEERWGGLDVLVNNAGVAGGGRIELTSMADWEWITGINLFGVVRGTRTFVPMLKGQGSGRVVNVASLAGLVHPPGMGSYNAVKAAVVAFSETAAHELAPYGIGVTVVCPSYFKTNLMASMRGDDPDVGAKIAAMVEQSPLTADDIAAAVLAGIDAGEEVIVADQPARDAVALKRADRATYDALMRQTAARMKEREDA
ncbi:MAG: SDR family NAD(P)-dependent oxidoreductase [Nocardioides sp.]